MQSRCLLIIPIPLSRRRPIYLEREVAQMYKKPCLVLSEVPFVCFLQYNYLHRTSHVWKPFSLARYFIQDD